MDRSHLRAVDDPSDDPEPEGSGRSTASGGDGGGLDDLPRRVERLEREVSEIRSILSRLEPAIARIDARVADMPSGKEFGELKGRVEGLPTRSFIVTTGLATSLALVALLLAAMFGAIELSSRL